MVTSNQTSNSISSSKRAFGVFADRQAATQALEALKASGFDMQHVSMIAKQAEDETSVSGVEISDHIGDQSVKTATGVVKETLTHSAWGSVLVGLSGLALPGIGPILAAGGVAAALVASVAGTGVGALEINNLVKALKELGIPQSDAEVYGDRLIQGNDLLILAGNDSEIDQAAQILGDQGIQDWGVYTAGQS